MPVKKVELAAGSSTKITLKKTGVDNLTCWTPDSPNLYGVVVSLNHKKQIFDKKYERFGWRIFRTEKDKLLLNGKPVHLKGDSWLDLLDT